jgi:hypothetical protein
VAFNYTYWYIDDILSINNNQFHKYVFSIYPHELETKDTTDCSTSAYYLYILLKMYTNGKITTQLHDKRDDFHFSIVNFSYLCSNIPISPADGVYISQLLMYARACSTYDQFLIRDSQLTNNLISKGFLKTRLQAAFRKYDSHYSALFCQYNLPLGQMLSDLSHTNC